jgi:hypothetical protein
LSKLIHYAIIIFLLDIFQRRTIIVVLLDILFFIALGLIFMVLFGYSILIKYFFKKKEPVRIPGFQPITIIVDAYETKKFINQKIDNIYSIFYPVEKRTLIFISDIEKKEIEYLQKEYPEIIFILRENKQNAYLEAFRIIDTDIIVFTDAETKLQKYSTRNVIECMNGRIAAVSGYFYLSDEPLKSYHKSKIKYHESIWNLNYLEGCIDTSSILNPRLLAVRRSLIKNFDQIAGINQNENTNALSQKNVIRLIPDEFAFFLRKQGLKGITDHKASLFEESPESTKSEFKKLAEKTARDIQVTYKNINFLFNPRYGVFGLFTFPFRRFFIIHFPFILAFIVVFALFHNPLLTSTAISFFMIYLYFSNNTYPVVFLLGVTRGWIEILTSRKEREVLSKNRETIK